MLLHTPFVSEVNKQDRKHSQLCLGCLAEHLFANCERLAVYGLRFSVLALAREHSSEVTHARERR